MTAWVLPYTDTVLSAHPGCVCPLNGFCIYFSLIHCPKIRFVDTRLKGLVKGIEIEIIVLICLKGLHLHGRRYSAHLYCRLNTKLNYMEERRSRQNGLDSKQCNLLIPTSSIILGLFLFLPPQIHCTGYVMNCVLNMVIFTFRLRIYKNNLGIKTSN